VTSAHSSLNGFIQKKKKKKKNVMVSTGNNRNPFTLLIGLGITRAIVEKSREFPQTIKSRTTTIKQSYWYISKGKEVSMSRKHRTCVFIVVLFLNSQEWLDKEIRALILNKVLLRQKKGDILTFMYILLSEIIPA
jgi:hypothetical protein